MDKIITLLTSLFNLTKVASVTLPGLLAAGGLALVLWPAVPIDVIPVVTFIEHETPNFGYAYDKPACKEGLATTDEVLPIDEEGKIVRQSNFYIADPNLVAAARKSIEIPGIPRVRRERIRDQFVLDLESQSLARCAELETSWQGQEKTENDHLATDIANLNTERSAAQANYLKYQEARSPLAAGYLSDMQKVEGKIDAKRHMLLANEQDIRERELRVKVLSDQQQVIKDRLGDPDRLRPRIGFDAFTTGLVNHVVAFILLSLAAAVMVTAMDRALFGALFEEAFDGF